MAGGRRRRMSLGVIGLASTAWVSALALVLRERRRAPDASRAPEAEDGPLVSVVVPARNEEGAIAATVSGLRGQRYERLEIIVIDDESTDHTGGRAREAAEGDARVRVVPGRPLPEGWLGKPWACHQGAELARGDWLLLTDADTELAPGAIGKALQLAVRCQGGGLTLIPRHRTGGVAERLVLPPALVTIGSFLTPAPLVRSRRVPIALGIGSFMLLRRDVYDRAGGHRAIRDHVVDDVGLAREIKRTGALVVPANGSDLISLRMYDGAAAMWRGWTKNASFGAGGGPLRGLLGAVGVAVLGVGPPAATIAGVARRDPALAAAGGTGWAAMAALHLLSREVIDTPRWLAPAFPLGMAFMSAAAGFGALSRLTGRGVVWRGRTYARAR